MNRIASILIILSLSFFSCTAYRAARQQKKDNKLFSKVVANDLIVDRVGAYYNAIHPIYQKPIYVKGKDSVIEVPYPVDVVRDSLIKAECPSLNLDSLKAQLTTHFYHSSTDTIWLPDSNCLPELNALRLNYSNLQGKYDQQAKQITEVKADKRKINIWLIGVSVFSVLAIGGLTYLLFKK